MEGVQRIFALHCDPRLEVGKLGTRVGPITSACDLLEVRLTSPGGHTARPHLTADLVEALGLLITQLPLLLTPPGRPALGHRPGLGRGAGRRGRQRDPAARPAARHPAHRRPRHVGRARGDGPVAGRPRSSRRTGVGYVLDHIRGVPPVVNDEASARMLRRRRHRRPAAPTRHQHRAVERRRGLRLVPRARARRHGPPRASGRARAR